MALRRFLSSLVAAAAARGRTDPSPPRWFLRSFRLDAMAAARARVDKASACAAARIDQGRSCAVARVHRARTCADARVSDLRAHGAARARAASAFYIRAHTRAGAAAACAGSRLLQASDAGLLTVLRILYGESAKTPTAIEIMLTVQRLNRRVEKISEFTSEVNRLLYIFFKLTPYEQGLVLTVLGAPFVAIGAALRYMTPATLSTVPECSCPFLGIYPCVEFPVQDGFYAVAGVIGTCGVVVLLTVGGLCMDTVNGIRWLLDLSCQTVAEMIKGKTPEELKTLEDFVKVDQATLFDLILTANYLRINVLLDLNCQTIAYMIKGRTPREILKNFNIMAGVAELKTYDEDFVKVDQATLFDLILAADCRDIKGLLDLTCQSVAVMIKGKTPEEIHKTLNIKNDFTPKEKEEVRKENQRAFE